MPTDLPTQEKQLLTAIAGGDEQAFTLLFSRYWPSIYSASLVLTKSVSLSEDISQEVLANLWEGRARAAEINNLKAWLFIAARNLIFNKLSRLKVEEAYQRYVLQTPAENAWQESRVLGQRIQTLVNQLPPQQQKVFRLSREEGLTYEQIADHLQISRHTVKEYMTRALATLRWHLRDYGPLATLLFSATVLG